MPEAVELEDVLVPKMVSYAWDEVSSREVVVEVEAGIGIVDERGDLLK